MNRRRIGLGLVALFVLLVVGVVVGGGIVLAAARAQESAAAGGVAAEEPELGVVIASVVPNGPAAEAGVARGDILLRIDDQVINDTADLQRYVADLEAGQEVELTVLHGDDRRTLTATVGEWDGRPYLGLVPCNDARQVGAVEVIPRLRGTMIIHVEPDSPADQAGLQIGDRIVAVDGQELEEDLAEVIAGYEPGAQVTLEIRRPGEESQEVSVKLDVHPEKEGMAYLGVRYLALPGWEGFDWQPFHSAPLDLERFPFPSDDLFAQGLVIRRVAEDSPAAEAGLQEGDVITAIGGEPLGAPQDLVDAVAAREPGDRLTLTVYDPGDEEESEVEVKLGENPEEEGAAYLGVNIVGFFRGWRLEEWEMPLWPKSLDRFLERLPFDWDELPFDPEDWDELPFDLEELDELPFDLEDWDGPLPFHFHWRRGPSLDRLPFDLPRFEFRLPPELLDEEPCCPENQQL